MTEPQRYRLCDQILGEEVAAARTAAARGERKTHKDRMRARLTAAARLRLDETVVERVTRGPQ